jgi:hypothetical protein
MRGRVTGGGLATFVAMAAAASACHPAAVTIDARGLAPVAHGEIQRIAVVPFATGEQVHAGVHVEGQEPLPEPPAETVERAIRTALERLPTWQLADDLVVGEALRKLYGEVRPPTPDEAVAVGRLIGVDAVVGGTVIAFEERIGAEYAAKQPARVDFEVELIRMAAGTVVWEAEYAERQRALSDDLRNFFGFLRTRGRWVRASELAAIGAAQVAGRLHLALYGVAATPIPAAPRVR